MKLILTTFVFLLVSFNAFCQLIDGELFEDNRKILRDIKHQLPSTNYNGKLIFNISVDNEGFVTSAVVDERRSTITSTPAKINAKKTIMKLIFEKGNQFPKYHKGSYQIIYTKN